jgi:EAL and modified HD-GYP domain-containing signal transduction protein
VFEQFISRQAILKDNLTLLGYDLRFREEDLQAASRRTSAAYLADASTMVFHWESLTAGRLAFIPFGRQDLLSGAALVLPRSKAVINISSDVPADAETIVACQSLKSAGYRLSLQGWTGQADRKPLAALADYLRVDVGKLESVTHAKANGRASLIADSVDTWEAHRAARELGIPNFRGSFFLLPQLFRRRAISGTRLNAMRLLQAIVGDPLDLGRIESVLREEPALTYKLLRYLNSPVMERKAEVRSIRMAISLLGEQEFRRWAALVAVVTPASDKSSELMRTAMTRAYFCEQLALRRDAPHSYDYFFTGLFSVMDAVLDRPLSDIIGELALSAEVRDALLGKPGELFDALQAAKNYEQGHWAAFQCAISHLSLPERCAPECFQSATQSAGDILQ